MMISAEQKQSMSSAQKAGLIAPSLRTKIDSFYVASADKTKDGVDAFQGELVKLLRDHDLVYDKAAVVPEELGVHPDNREKAGLVPIDVHDLLLAIYRLGWSMDKVDIMACEIPPSDEGEGWRRFNQELALKSDELLAPCKPDRLKFVTARGSHTAACARLIAHGGRGVHDELCDGGGRISLAKMRETRPSMARPLSGLPVTVLRHEIVTEVP